MPAAIRPATEEMSIAVGINSQLSTLNSRLSTFNSQLSTLDSQLSILNFSGLNAQVLNEIGA
jgi:hypothetical protein